MRYLLLAIALLVGCGPGGAALNTPVPGTYTLNCTGNNINDTQELNAAVSGNATQIIVPIGTCSLNASIGITPVNASNVKIVGVDRNLSIIQAAPLSNIAYLFSSTFPSGTLQNFTVANLTLDANYSAQTAGNASSIFDFAGGVTSTNITLDGVNFLNCGSRQCVEFLSSALTSSQVTIKGSRFVNMQCGAIYATNLSDVSITDNYFTNYDQQTSPECPAIGGYTQNITSSLPIPVARWKIQNNLFEPIDATGFAVEFVPASLNPIQGFVISGNVCNADGVGGCGISMPCDNCVVSHNSMTLGEFGDRSGCECSGNNLVIEGNVIQSGQITLSGNTTAYGPGGPSGMLVANNAIQLLGYPRANGISAIQVSGVNHFDIVDNTIQINFTNTVNAYPAIYLGFYGSVGSANYANVTGNHITDLSQTPNMQCIRLYENSATFSTHVTIKRNICDQMLYGLYFNSGATYSTYVVACGNDLTTTGTPINTIPTNTGDSVVNGGCPAF